jgi:hypothetical protein
MASAPFAKVYGVLKQFFSTNVHWYSLLVMGACLLFCFVLYAPALGSYFVAEDLRSVHFGWSDVVAEFSSYGMSQGFRPGTVLYFAVNNLLWGRNQVGHHAVVFFLHGLVGWLTYLIAQRVTGRRVTATLAALIFVGAPVHAEAVIWLAAAAGTVVSGLICMLAAWLWISRENGPDRLTTGVVAVLYLLALLVKEVAIPLPALLMLLDWAIGRIPARGSLEAIARRVLSYWPLGVAFGLYAFLHWRAGILKGSLRYGLRMDVDFGQVVEWWAMYARDLFQPLSNFLEWKIGPMNWMWLGAFLILLHVVRRARWAALWVLLALSPAATAYGERLTYLAVVGFSIVVAVSLIDLAQQPFKQALCKSVRLLSVAGVVLFLIALLVADVRAVHRDAANWVEAGRLTWTIPRQARALVPEVPPGAELFFLDLPDNVHGAYAFRWGIVPEVRYVYGNPTLNVHQVVIGPQQWRKVSLSSIECEAEVPRFFFRYYADSDELRLVSPREFGLDCHSR